MNQTPTLVMCRVMLVGFLALVAGCASMGNRWSLPHRRPLAADSSAPSASAPPVSMSLNDDIQIEIPDDIPEFQGPEAETEGEAGPNTPASSDAESTPYRTTIRGQNPTVR